MSQAGLSQDSTVAGRLRSLPPVLNDGQGDCRYTILRRLWCCADWTVAISSDRMRVAVGDAADCDVAESIILFGRSDHKINNTKITPFFLCYRAKTMSAYSMLPIHDEEHSVTNMYG